MDERVRRYATANAETGCWEWNRSKTADGYGRLGVENKLWLAHRWAYETIVGPIPKGMTLDHLCRNRACMNPDHLEPCSLLENIARRPNDYSRNAAARWETLRGKKRFSSVFRGVSANSRKDGFLARVHSRIPGKAWVVVGRSPLEEGADYCLKLLRHEVPLAPL